MAHIETLIQFHKKESENLGFQQPMEAFWITFRIMDYFYKQTIDGILKNSLIHYCKLLEGSSIVKRYSGSVANMIEDFKTQEQNLIDTTLLVLTNHGMEYNLNPGSVTTILQMCNFGKMFSRGGDKRKSRCRRCKRKSKTI